MVVATVTVGHEYVVKLPANRTTGYSWELSRKPANLKLERSAYHVDKDCKQGMVGCSGEQEFFFKAIRAGKAELNFEYKRPWEKTIGQKKHITLKIVNQKSSREISGGK